MRVLVTGATGYVGGRLLQRLLERQDLTIRVLVRDAERARGRGWPNRVEVVEGDLMDAASLDRWLADPQSVKPGTAMPNLGLSDNVRTELVAWLGTLR